MPEKIIPSIGRIVHYRLAEKDDVARDKVGEMRPALILKVWSEPGQPAPGNPCNLRVFLDGENDALPAPTIVAAPIGEEDEPVAQLQKVRGGDLWVTSAEQGEGPGQWQVPPRI